jgi:hypothetical protein
MSKKMASIIMGYGLLLAGLGLIVRSVTPETETIASVAGLIGGGLCLLCGIVAWIGHKRRVWIGLTVIAIALLLLSQTVQAWMASTGESGTVVVAWLLTFMFVMTVGMLMYVFHGERPPEFYTPRTARRDNAPSRGEVVHSDDGRHQLSVLRPVKITSAVVAVHLIVLPFFFFKPPVNYFAVTCLSTVITWSAVFSLRRRRKWLGLGIIAGALIQVVIQQVAYHAWLASEAGECWPLVQFVALQYVIAIGSVARRKAHEHFTQAPAQVPLMVLISLLFFSRWRVFLNLK